VIGAVGETDAAATKGLGVRPVEAATALVFAGIGALAIWDSLRIGAGWGADGPRSGYFPFWLGVLMLASSLGSAVGALRRPAGESGLFVSWAQLRMVASVLLPTIVYVALIPFTGLYVASALLVMWFMIVLGGFAWWRSVLGGLATAIVTFAIFEFGFLVPLPKGPIEELLGY